MIRNDPSRKKARDNYHRPAPTDVPIDQLPTVRISDQLYELAEHIAAARSITYRPIDGGCVYGDQQSIDANLTGVLGELAVQELAGATEQAIYLRGDPGFDLVINDRTVDVKSTATDMRLPDLLIPYDQDLVAEWYVLVHRIEPRAIRIVGFAPKREIENREPTRHPGDSLNYVVPPDELYIPHGG